MTSNRSEKSGIAKDVQNKISAKYSAELATQCLEWIKETINDSLNDGEEAVDFSTSGDQENLSTILHNGVVLVRLLNALSPGSVKAKSYARPPTMPFKQMELINMFITKINSEFGIPDHENFQTVDLFEDQNLHQVVCCLQSLGRKAKAKGLTGFGPTEAKANVRDFTDEQLRSGQNVIGLQMGTNAGASQAGMTFGNRRHIMD